MKRGCVILTVLLACLQGQSQINEKDTLATSISSKNGSVYLQVDVLPDYIDLNWSKGPDDLISYFELYRSADGLTYNIIRQFHPKTFDAPDRTLSYRDEDPLRGKNYYRLIAYDQHTQEKRVVELVAEYKNQPRKVQPTVISKGNQLNILNYDGEEMHLWIFTTAGAPIIQKVVASSVVNIGSENLSSGLYVYQLVNRKKMVVSTGKFVLQ